MSGHGDHSADGLNQADRDLEMKLQGEKIDHLRAAGGLNPSLNAIPMIKFIRDSFGVGLKEAKDLFDGLMDASGKRPYDPEQSQYRTFLVVGARDYTLSRANIRDALDRAESAERVAEALREECKRLERERAVLAIEIRVREVQEEVAYRERMLAELRADQDRIRNGGEPYSELNLDDDGAPF